MERLEAQSGDHYPGACHVEDSQLGSQHLLLGHPEFPMATQGAIATTSQWLRMEVCATGERRASIIGGAAGEVVLSRAHPLLALLTTPDQ